MSDMSDLARAAKEMLNPGIMALTVAHARLEVQGAVMLLPPDVAEGFRVIADLPVIRVPGLTEPMLGLPASAFGG